MTDITGSKMNHVTGLGYPMGAVPSDEGIQFTTCIPYKRTLELLIYNEKGHMIDHVNMNDHKVGNGTCSCVVKVSDSISYCYEADGIKAFDTFARNSTASRRFGDGKDTPDRGKIYIDDFDWGKDSPLSYAFNDIIAYQLHVRGFTAHSSSKVKNRGKFSGIVEKIPHLKDLGINQIVLMPCYEFDEITRKSEAKTMDAIDYRIDPSDDAYRINFWGFVPGSYYMPKASYSNGDPVNEFKSMVKALHASGIEVIMRFYFPDTVNKAFIPDILEYWAREYHVDGFFLMGSDIPVDMIAANVYLRDRKIYNPFFDKDSIVRRKYGYNKNMAFVNSDFMNTCRKYLKSDENQLADFLYRQRLNPSDVHTVNYITDYCGFTLRDLVSYDYKHNEDNKEDNTDGENFNYSWNCGVEGMSRKRSIISLRLKQIKNALVFVLLAQGTPMLLAGDEFCNTQNGNNNPYCQDNETGWVTWKQNKTTQEIYDFTKLLIKLRKDHPILHPEREFRIMDYAACGFPDLSYHGDMAWNPKFDNHLRHIGLMICGKYARVSRIKEDDFFFVAYNMHWEDHTFALPKLSKGLVWKVCLITCDEGAGRIIYETVGEGGDTVTVPDRTIAVLTSAENTALAENDTEKRKIKDDRR